MIMPEPVHVFDKFSTRLFIKSIQSPQRPSVDRETGSIRRHKALLSSHCPEDIQSQVPERQRNPDIPCYDHIRLRRTRHNPRPPRYSAHRPPIPARASHDEASPTPTHARATNPAATRDRPRLCRKRHRSRPPARQPSSAPLVAAAPTPARVVQPGLSGPLAPARRRRRRRQRPLSGQAGCR